MIETFTINWDDKKQVEWLSDKVIARQVFFASLEIQHEKDLNRVEILLNSIKEK